MTKTTGLHINQTQVASASCSGNEATGIATRLNVSARALAAGALLMAHTAFAIDEFVITDIRVDGLQRLSAGTVFNYLPLRVGDAINDASAQRAIRALFKTGLFRDVALDREGSVLVVNVIERPSISQLDVIGNREFDDETLTKSMDQAGFTVGRVFDQALLDKVVQDLTNLYLSRGYYDVDIESTITPLERNRVSVTLDVVEGDVAKIREINIVGNEAFTDREILKQFNLRQRSATRFWSKRDRYSKQQLEADLETLRSYYQDRGYLDFLVESTQVTLTPDREDVFVTIAISEGATYLVDSVNLAGETVVPVEELEALLSVKKGDVFSRKEVSKSRAELRNRLADDGYAFASINAVPRINKENQSVAFNFVIDPGRRVYVRRINISGNTVTRDEVIRRELRQLEGGWFSEGAIRRSRVRLQKLGYFDDVRIETPAVPGELDQVDVEIAVVERSTGSFLFGVGYSDADGVLLQANVAQRNLFGTGKEVNISFDNSESTRVVDLRYRDPYHTIDGVSRGFSITQREVNSAEAQTAEYIANTLTAGVDYRYPLSEFNNFSWGLAYEKIDLEGTDESPPEFAKFINGFPSNDNFKLTANLTHDSRNDFFFPSAGRYGRLALEASVPGSDLEYWKLSARGSWYRQLTGNYVFKIGGEIGYGGGYGDSADLPFFKNFFAGGPTTVRGFDSRSLGPRDSGDTPEPIGGSTRILANMELIFPVPGTQNSKDKRLSLFVDAGQVYGPDDSADFGDLRLSAGVAFNWFSPVGPLAISYGIPLNKEDGDDEERLQLTLGTFFR